MVQRWPTILGWSEANSRFIICSCKCRENMIIRKKIPDVLIVVANTARHTREKHITRMKMMKKGMFIEGITVITPML